MGKQCRGFSAFGKGLIPMEDRWISKLFLISVRFVYQFQSPLQISLINKNFIALLCSFFTSIFKSLNLRGVTKTTFTKITVTQQWKVITKWNFDHEHRIDHRSRCTAWLHAAMSSFAFQSELSVLFWQPLCVMVGSFWKFVYHMKCFRTFSIISSLFVCILQVSL